MAKVKVKLDKAAVRREILKSEDTKELIQKYADAAFQKVSNIEGYEMEGRSYAERNGVAIYAKDYPAISDNLKNNTLLKAVK